jgi:hypothetical protein
MTLKFHSLESPSGETAEISGSARGMQRQAFVLLVSQSREFLLSRKRHIRRAAFPQQNRIVVTVPGNTRFYLVLHQRSALQSACRIQAESGSSRSRSSAAAVSMI